jgi:hypothetical protein
MERYPFAWPRSSAGLALGAVLAGSIAIGMPNRSSAQEQPAAVPVAAPPAAEPAPPVEKSLPAGPAAATPAEAAPATGPHVVLLLPTTFTEYQNAVSGLEAIPDWTDAARKNLDEAAHEALEVTGGLRLEALPGLTPEESAILHDHIALAQRIVGAGVQYKNGDWHKHRTSFDRSFGDGLRFLHERTGADYALLIDGTQVRQSGGRIAMKLLGSLAAAAAGVIVVPTGGGGEIVNVCLLDLNHGTVTWFNSSRAIDVFGSAGADLRNPESTKAAMRKLFASYPTIPALAD